MIEFPYCLDCEFLSITELEQDELKKYNSFDSQPHICELFEKRVKHLSHHPHLPRLQECIDEYGLESLP